MGLSFWLAEKAKVLPRVQCISLLNCMKPPLAFFNHFSSLLPRPLLPRPLLPPHFLTYFSLFSSILISLSLPSLSLLPSWFPGPSSLPSLLSSFCVLSHSSSFFSSPHSSSFFSSPHSSSFLFLLPSPLLPFPTLSSLLSLFSLSLLSLLSSPSSPFPPLSFPPLLSLLSHVSLPSSPFHPFPPLPPIFPPPLPALQEIQNFLEQDYKMPTYAVFIIIALGTIVVGLTLGGVSVPKHLKILYNIKWSRGRERNGKEGGRERGIVVGGREG